MMSQPQESVQPLIERVTSRMLVLLENEFKIAATNIRYDFNDVKQLKLNYLTSMIVIEEPMSVIFAFSFDEPLAYAVMKSYTIELDVDPSSESQYVQDSAADVINIVLGNSLTSFQIYDKAIELTPPIVLVGAKTIYRKQTATFYSSEIETEQGNMKIFCLGPQVLFDHRLNYKGD
ncbi:chemotaxis protein CheX [Pleionea sediminis]|uniref:chemotaxis protein CheX n=1 Tax=Pleionea sediminis TaxID=2569479 RepID=UPI0013DE6D43|nr:chemotaxis protein CheX [Pleionea sediminis]